MSLQLERTRPSDALQRIMTSFKHFEKKLDKLQDDVNFHGQTLHELRMMVINLVGGSIMSPDRKFYDLRRAPIKTTAIQYEDRILFNEPLKLKKKTGIVPLQSKLKAKSFQLKDTRASQMNLPYIQNIPKFSSNTTEVLDKHVTRHKKAEASRKVSTLRTQKSQDKKRNKIAK